jgi:hypothetical protein
MAKQKVIYDLEDFPLKKNEGGLYSIFPYEKLDKHHKGLFKVGLTDSFDKRFEQYHTSYPIGFYDLLASPNKLRENYRVEATHDEGKRPSPEAREVARNKSKMKYYRHIEDYIFKDLNHLGADRLKATTRIREADERGGNTEWFYTSPPVLDKAFHNAFKIYGGRNYSPHLNEINKMAKENEKNSDYTGEIHYKIYSRKR